MQMTLKKFLRRLQRPSTSDREDEPLSPQTTWTTMPLTDQTMASADNMEPIVAQPKSGTHKQSLIVLHGRGSNGYMFGSTLLETTIPKFKSLQDALPDTKFIFPTAAKRRAQIFNRSVIHQWFDNWSLETPTEREELQFDGLRESSSFVHSLLQAEIDAVGPENVILWGLSQGCATTLVSMLLWRGPRFAAAIGMCGWLPLRKRIEEAAREQVVADDDPFETADSPSSPRGRAEQYLREELDIPGKSTAALPDTPIFLGHGIEDAKVSVNLKREAKSLLDSLGYDVEDHEYEGLGHWYSGPMLHDILLFIRGRAKWAVCQVEP